MTKGLPAKSALIFHNKRFGNKGSDPCDLKTIKVQQLITCQ